ncbi:uncharacterized protein LOC129002695 [Macrosteles quadrilineatus]|uniref:uncharacterized protein LOC129002695 n=1 Tax=Macrosteles quadrilineatus TaxID=74068 RepID=UPI0023E28505|nr:uncharacterized protein LOC129002695 [Macrosteles quadrilineatus]
MAFLANLVCAALVAAICTTVSAKKVTEDDSFFFESYYGIKLSISTPVVANGECTREIVFDYGRQGAPPLRSKILIKCHRSYDEDSEGERYIVSNVLYSKRPEDVIVIDHEGICVKFVNFSNGKGSGGQALDEESCKKIKKKVKYNKSESLVNRAMAMLMSPSDLSGLKRKSVQAGTTQAQNTGKGI